MKTFTAGQQKISLGAQVGGTEDFSAVQKGDSQSLNPRDLRGHLADDWAWRNLVSNLLIAQGELSQANDFLWCESNFLGVEVCETDLLHSKAIPATCHLRYCPHCARRDAARLVHTYTPQVVEIARTSQVKEYRLREIVLTLNVSLYADDIRDQVAIAHKAVAQTFDHFLGGKFSPSNRARWSEPASKYYTGEGYIYSLEFGENGHKLHFHILYFGRWISKFKLTEYWEHLTGNKITWINAVSKSEAAVAESLKYIAKVSKCFPDPDTGELIERLPSPQFIARLAYVLKNTRRIITRGCFRGLDPEQREPGEELGERICKTCGGPAELVSVDAWHIEYYAKFHRLLDLRPGNKIATPEETAQVANSPPKLVFGKLLTDQAIEEQAAILRSKDKKFNDSLSKAVR